MASQKRWYLVAYDIRDPVRLRKVAKHLKGYGSRLQYSIFRCRLSERQIERLQWELTKLLQEEDDLFIVGLCNTCGDRLKKKTGNEEWTEGIAAYEII